MTEQLAKQLIEHYEQCISKVRQCTILKSAKEICKKYSAERGVCYCATIVFDKPIYGCKWLLEKSTFVVINSDYIANVPAMCETIPDIITALQTRVDIVKTFKNENNG